MSRTPRSPRHRDRWTAISRSAWTDVALAGAVAYLATRLLGSSVNRAAADRGMPRFDPLDDLVGLGLVWILVALVMIVTRQRWLVLSAVAGIAVAGHVAQREKLAVLEEPLLPTDLGFLGNPGFLTSQTSASTVVLPFVAAGVVLLIAVVADRRRRRRVSTASAPVRRRRRIVSLVLAPVLALTTAVALDFNRPGNSLRALYDPDEIDCCAWGQLENYAVNGFVAGFLSNVPSLVMRPPDGYGRARIEEIVARYTDDLPDDDGTRLSDLDVVVVLSESVADPTRLDGLTIDRDPLARLRARSAEGWSGQTVATYYGTGTSTMEWQVLTGQSIGLVEPQIFSPYQSIVAGSSTYPSIVGWLAAYGGEAVAVHPFSGSMYQRRSVYDAFGFESFLDQGDFSDTTPLGTNPFISDTDTFTTTLDLLEAATTSTLVNVVTMQNHSPFFGWYPELPAIDGLVGDADEAVQLATWIRGLELSDLALEEFLGALATRERPTVVVYYGDHYPPVLPTGLRDANTEIETLLTPVLLWSNVDVLDPGRDLGVVDPTDLLPLAAQMVGARLPPYYRLVQHVQDVVGSVGRGQIVASDGTVRSDDDLTPEQRQVLDDYRQVQYDFAVGAGYGIDALWYDWVP